MKVICKNCDKEFMVKPSVVKKGGGIFCNRECLHKHRTIKQKCLICNKDMVCSLSSVKNYGKKYCSTNCRIKAQEGRILLSKKVVNVCKNCNKEFLVKPSNCDAKYCSRRCRFENSKEGDRGGIIKLNCLFCNKEFKALRYRKKNAKFCSHSCYAKNEAGKKHLPCSSQTKERISIANKGINNGMYGRYGQGNTFADLVEKTRRIYEYKNWRLNTYERDSFTCQMIDCDRTEKSLNAHHVIKFVELFKKYDIKTIEQAISCDELWEIDNGITLCKKCHTKIQGKEEKYQSLFQEIIKFKKSIQLYDTN